MRIFAGIALQHRFSHFSDYPYCRHEVDLGMHGCRPDKVTQNQLQIRSPDENAQIFIILASFMG